MLLNDRKGHNKNAVFESAHINCLALLDSVTFDIYSFNFSFMMHFKMLKMMNDAPESQMITILTALMA